MGYRTFASVKVALIGMSGNITDYALRYADSRYELLVALKDDGDNKKISKALSAINNISVCSIEEAAEKADLIVIATAPKYVREVAYWLGDVRNKVIIDASANFQNTIDEQINTFWAIKAITGSFNVIKVFTTKGYEQMLKPLFGDINTRVLIAGDSKKAKEIAKIIATDLGIRTFFDMGGSESIPLFNEMTIAWVKLDNTTDKALIAANQVRI